jgi:Gpi18-like mannosyltransferase
MRGIIKSKIFWIFIGAFVFHFALSFFTWHPDVNNHADWGVRFWQYGPAKFYSGNVWNFTWPNQPPGTIYIFAGVRKMYEFVFSILWLINVRVPIFPSVVVSFSETNLYPALLKLPAITADLGIAWIIYKLVKDVSRKELSAVLGASLWLFNPVVWYNSAIWGQYDSVINFFVLLSFYLLIKRKLILSMLFFFLSLYIKASLIIFAPIYLVIVLRQKYLFQKYFWSILVSSTAILLLTIPFSGNNPFTWLYELYKDKVFTDQLHVVTANAFNFWGLMYGVKDSAVAVSDSVKLFAVTLKNWSYIIFAFFYLISLKIVFKKQDVKSIFWAVSLVALSSFMFLTNMHERYLFPVFPYLTALAAVYSPLLGSYILISLVGLLNLYNFWWYPNINILIDLLKTNYGILPRVFSGLNLILYAGLLSIYRRYAKNN